MRTLLALLLTATALAGCFGGDDPVDPSEMEWVFEPDWVHKAIFAGADPLDTDYIVDHDHNDPVIHADLSTPNFRVVGHTPLTSEYHGTTAGQHFCGQVSERGDRRIATVTSHTTDVAMTVMDVTDPTDPQYLGELVMPFVFAYDTAVTADGRYAVIAGNPDTSGYDDGKGPSGLADVFTPDGLMAAPVFRDACGNESQGSVEDPIPYGYSTILVDLSDPTRPTVVDAREHPSRNIHSVSTYTEESTIYVATSGLGRTTCNRITLPDGTRVPPTCPGDTVPGADVPIPSAGHATGFYNFFTVEDTPTGPRLLDYALYSSANTGHPDTFVDTAFLANGHMDATIAKHPMTGELLAYLADWDGGFIIVSIDEQGLAEHRDTWGVLDESLGRDDSGNIHHAVAVPQLIDGKAIVITGQEIGGHTDHRPTGQIVALDVSDPTNVVPAWRWTLPTEMFWDSPYAFSPHYPIWVNGTMFTAMYHGGVWAADASTEYWPDLPSTGAFLPDAHTYQVPAPFKPGPAPEVLEVLDIGDGNLLVYDANSGAWVVEWLGAHPDVPPAEPWADNPWIDAESAAAEATPGAR